MLSSLYLINKGQGHISPFHRCRNRGSEESMMPNLFNLPSMFLRRLMTPEAAQPLGGCSGVPGPTLYKPAYSMWAACRHLRRGDKEQRVKAYKSEVALNCGPQPLGVISSLCFLCVSEWARVPGLMRGHLLPGAAPHPHRRMDGAWPHAPTGSQEVPGPCITPKSLCPQPCGQ